jgi:hypothetical protein
VAPDDSLTRVRAEQCRSATRRGRSPRPHATSASGWLSPFPSATRTRWSMAIVPNYSLHLPEDARRVVEEFFIRPAMSPRDYVDLVEEIALAVASPTFDVQFGPAGVQCCSPALLETIAEHSAARVLRQA